MQFTIPAYLFSTALLVKQFNSTKTFFLHGLNQPPPPPPSLASSTHRFLTITFEKIFKRGFQLNGHDIVAPVLSFRIRLLVKNELKTPFCTASHAPQTGFFRYPIADSNLKIFDENEKFQMPVAALYKNKKKIRCQLPHL